MSFKYTNGSLKKRAAIYDSTKEGCRPTSTFVMTPGFDDKLGNGTYITARTDFGGWANYDTYGIAKNMYFNNGSSYMFAYYKSAPLMISKSYSSSMNDHVYYCSGFCLPYKIKTGLYGKRSVINPPYEEQHSRDMSLMAYWDFSTSKIKIIATGDGKGKEFFIDSYGLFFCLVGGGGGGGGADTEWWGQGQPGGGGGGGGAAIVAYIDFYALFQEYGPYTSNTYVTFQAGNAGTGGSGGAGFSGGGHGEWSYCYIWGRNTLLTTIGVEGGIGGDGHAWDVGADSAGGRGGYVSAPSSKFVSYLLVSDGHSGMTTGIEGTAGGVGRRGAGGGASSAICATFGSTPFGSFSTIETFSYGGKTYQKGGMSPAYGNGGGGGASFGMARASNTQYCGMGGGGHGGGSSGASGEGGMPGGVIIFDSVLHQ